MELWEKGIHAVLVGDAEAEVAAREVRMAQWEEDYDNLEWELHSTVLSGNICQVACRARNRRGGGSHKELLHQDQYTSIESPLGKSPCHEGNPRGGTHVRRL